MRSGCLLNGCPSKFDLPISLYRFLTRYSRHARTDSGNASGTYQGLNAASAAGPAGAQSFGNVSQHGSYASGQQLKHSGQWYAQGNQQPRNQRRFPRGEGPEITGTYIGPSSLHYEAVDSTYFVRENPRQFFIEGKVIAVIMNETAGENAIAPNALDYNTSASINRVKYANNFVYTNVRRFVVVRQRREFCYACPIFTYRNRATTKPGVRAEEHGIAYTWGLQPTLLDGETGITKTPIPVVMAVRGQTLQRASRIYYGIHHPIQFNVKVKEIGYVPHDQIPDLVGNWKEEDERESRQAAVVTETAEDPDTDDDTQEGATGIAHSAKASAKGKEKEPLESMPSAAPNIGSYHPKKNKYVYSAKHNPSGYHPQINQLGFHPKHNPQVRDLRWANT